MSEKFVKISLFDLANKQISNADLFIDAMWYVPLETSERCLIGETQKIELDSHSVFIMDQFNAKAVFRFALSGVFLNQIEKRGNGPGEYGEITDFAIVEDKIAIYDHPKNKIHYYTKDGTFIYDKSVPFFYSQFVYRSPNTTCFILLVLSIIISQQYVIIIYCNAIAISMCGKEDFT